jgi:RND superfamily putative drug exporter
MASFLHRVGGAAVRHRRLVVLAWLVAALSLFGLSRTAGGELSDEFRVPGVESQQALDLMIDRFPEMSGVTAQVVFHAEDGTFDDLDNALAMEAAVEAIGDLPAVGFAADPNDTGAISPDRTIGMAYVQYEVQASELPEGAFEALEETAEIAREAGLQVEFGGELVRFVERPETGTAEMIGIAAAVVILLMAFGSVIAGGMPIGLALFGLATGFSLVTIVAAFMDIAEVAPILASMIGLGVGIDYALFVVTRHRQHLAEGMTVEESAARANATAGQAVVFAGGTVVVAICGLALVGIPFIATMGYAAAIVVGVMVLASVTLLPALLGFAGMKLATSSLPWAKKREAREAREREAGVESSGGWQRWGNHVARHPWVYVIVSTAVLLLLAVPLLSMRLGQTDAGNNAADTTSRKAYDLIADGFGPGMNGPLVLSVGLSGDDRRDGAALDTLVEELRADGDVLFANDAIVNPAGDAAMITVIPRSAPQAEATTELVHRIRSEIVPQAEGVETYVGGMTATFIDVSDRVAERMPWFIGAIVGMSFLLLVLVFRSILVPLKAAVMNVLAIGAAYGVVVAVFQWGWAKDLIGLESTVPIVSFVPMFMFAILFGLSMDYEVFLLSRVREEYLHTGDNTRSVTTGIASTARVIASAALIMISVFFGFVLGTDPIIKMMGVGLAVAVFLDATIVRLVLVPASMRLMGHANWWLPKWLDRILPNLDIEGDSGLPAPVYREGFGPAVVALPAPVEDEVEAPAVVTLPAAAAAAARAAAAATAAGARPEPAVTVTVIEPEPAVEPVTLEPAATVVPVWEPQVHPSLMPAAYAVEPMFRPDPAADRDPYLDLVARIEEAYLEMAPELAELLDAPVPEPTSDAASAPGLDDDQRGSHPGEHAHR